MLSVKAAANALAINPELAFAQYLATGEKRSFLNAIEALEQAWREQPGNTVPLRPLIYELTYFGYQREAHRIAKQYATVDPLSPVANYSLGETLHAIGQTSEAMASLTVAYNLENRFASWFVPSVHLIEGRDEIAISQFEADLELNGISDTAWVRDLVNGARDPLTGQDYMDRRYSQIFASIPDEHALYGRFILRLFYLLFGFFDKFYEIIFAAEPNDQSWTDADVLVWQGMALRPDEFTSHPRYLEVAELIGITRIWEQRGPPDFCEKVDGEWVCE